MFGSYWYIEGADGRHYCYSKDVSYRCPVAMRAERISTEADDVPPPFEWAQAASLIGVSEQSLVRMVKRASHGGRARVDGRITDQCAGCGARMERLGFRYWIEGEPTEETASTSIAQRLTGSSFTTVEGPWYAKTKKDAQAWAQMRVKQTKEAA